MNSSITQLLLKTFLAAVLAISIVSCGSDSTAREQAVEAAKEDAAQSKEIAPMATEPSRPPVVGSLPLTISNTKAAKGAEACVSVTARQFNEIVSMQYTMTWDPAVLKFKEVKGFGLPNMSAQNFGARAADKGILAYSWFDANVQGITQPDGKQLYEVCFEAVGSAGSSSAIQFADAPVVIEISNSASQFLDIEAKDGSVTVE